MSNKMQCSFRRRIRASFRSKKPKPCHQRLKYFIFFVFCSCVKHPTERGNPSLFTQRKGKGWFSFRGNIDRSTRTSPSSCTMSTFIITLKKHERMLTQFRKAASYASHILPLTLS